MKLAIVGAGLAGLAAAHRLRARRPEVEIVLFEKSRGVGGRAATRRANAAVFDHGAQYVKGTTPELTALLTEALPHATLVDIARPVWTFDAAGTISEGESSENSEPKWTYSDGLTRLAKGLAEGLEVRSQTRVGRLSHGQGFVLFDEQDHELMQADAVLLTPPAPQSSALIEASMLPGDMRNRLVAELGKVRYRPCLTLTLGFDSTLRERPWYALVNADKQHPISWLAYEHLKPGREMRGQHIVIAQMAPQWSHDHWDDPLPALTAQVETMLSELLDEELPTPRWADRQGWRFALPDGQSDFATLNSALPGLFFAGDYTAGRGRIHLAIEQGWAVAGRIADLADEFLPA